MDKNKFCLGSRLFNTASPRLGAPTQRKAHPQVGRPNARPQHKCKARPHVCNLGAPTQRKARPKVGCPNATQGEFARWAQNEKLIRNKNVHTREHLAKRRAGGWIRTNFCLEVDFLIRPHPAWVPQCNERGVDKMGTQTQCKARLQDGRPNATQRASSRWAPKRKTDLQRKHPHKGALG